MQDGSNFVQLWQRRNWHWYCVREVWRGSAGPLRLLWCEHSDTALFVIAHSGRVERWELFFAADISLRGSVAVIDGSEVLLTPLRLALVPPPMCAARASTPHAVSAVAWGEVKGCECLALAHGGGVSVVASVEEDLWEETVQETADSGVQDQASPCTDTICSGLLELPAESQGLADAVKSCVCLTWLHSELLALVVPACVHQQGGVADAVVMLRLSWPPQDGSTGLWGTPTVTSCTMHIAQSSITACLPWDAMHVLLQDNRGKLALMDEQGNTSALPNLSAFPEHCQQLLVHRRSQHAGCLHTPRVLGLAGSGKLFCGREPLATNVNSMCLRHWGPGGAYLLVTTRSQVLYCAQLEQTRDGVPTPVTPDEAPGGIHTSQVQLQLSGAATRAVEAGAELVAAPPGTSLAVLQMPRGNLEGVHVRALTLASVTESLLAHQYGNAMEEAASHRVDLNVLVDFQWPRFIDNVGEFVKQVKADSVCDLLSSLRPESCLSEGQIYASDLARPAEVVADTGDGVGAMGGAAGGRNEGFPAADTSKVNLVCRSLQKECIQVGGAHLKASLMSFVRCVLPSIVTCNTSVHQCCYSTCQVAVLAP